MPLYHLNLYRCSERKEFCYSTVPLALPTGCPVSKPQDALLVPSQPQHARCPASQVCIAPCTRKTEPKRSAPPFLPCLNRKGSSISGPQNRKLLSGRETGWQPIVGLTFGKFMRELRPHHSKQQAAESPRTSLVSH